MRQKGRTLQSAQRVLDALLAIVSTDSGITPKELALQLGTSLSTAYYLIHTLQTSGFITQSKRGVVTIGPKLYELLDHIRDRRHLDLSDLVSITDQISSATESRAYLAVWSNHDLEIVHIRGRRGQRELPGLTRGFRGAAHALALGKTLLSKRPVDDWPEYLCERRFPAFTPFTITTPEKFALELEKVQVEHLAYDIEEFTLGSCCISIPVLDYHDHTRTTAALAIAVPTQRFHQERDWFTSLMQYYYHEVNKAPSTH